MEEWYISGCLQCIYAEHCPAHSASEHCPNDGSVLMRLPGIIPAWDIIEVARAMTRSYTIDLQRGQLTVQLQQEQVKIERALERV